MANGMMLHCGASAATMADVLSVGVPEPTKTHFPIAHHVMIEQTVEALGHGGWEVDADRMEFGLWQESARMFGVMALRGTGTEDYDLVVGIRNSHDRSFAAGICLGSRVFVCDNLAFSSEVVRLRKHTRNIMRDLNGIIVSAVGEIASHRISLEQRIAAYKAAEIDTAQVHDILIRSVNAKVMANSYIPRVLKEWHEPTHEEFAPRTAWSLQNAYTEVLKATNMATIDRRTMALNGLLDMETDAFGVIGDNLPTMDPETGELVAPVNANGAPADPFAGLRDEIESGMEANPHLN